MLYDPASIVHYPKREGGYEQTNKLIESSLRDKDMSFRGKNKFCYTILELSYFSSIIFDIVECMLNWFTLFFIEFIGSALFELINFIQSI